MCSFDNAEVYAKGKAEEIMGQAIKVPQQVPRSHTGWDQRTRSLHPCL